MLVVFVYAFLVASFSLVAFLLVPAFLPPVMRLFLELGFMMVDSFLGPMMARFLTVPRALTVWMVDLHPVAPLGRTKAKYKEQEGCYNSHHYEWHENDEPGHDS
tara:strand:+ start:15017 stop:15328 length:312 start_codon:yes stop_codon:yes gene_type:complete